MMDKVRIVALGSEEGEDVDARPSRYNREQYLHILEWQANCCPALAIG